MGVPEPAVADSFRVFLSGVFYEALISCTHPGSGSSSSSGKPQSKADISGSGPTNTIPQKNALALAKHPVTNLDQVKFQSLDSSSIAAIKTFD